jgi:hypothetical protein
MNRPKPSCVTAPSTSTAALGTGTRRIRDWTGAAVAEHFVQFYRTDEYLIECLAGYVADALWNRQPAVVIATAEHRLKLEQRLRTKGVDLVNATMRRDFMTFDAREVMSRFMVEGRPDPVAFGQTVGAVIKEAIGVGRKLRAFGEMVALLWMEGRREAAIELEQLWNNLSREFSFSLFCAYPAACADATGDGPTLSHICEAHTCVVSLTA